MKRIKLTLGRFAIVDDIDYTWLNQYNWCAHKDNSGNFYATRNSYYAGKKVMILMHRQILGLEHGDKRIGDHIYHNTLDNRRNKLRVCTCGQNNMNRKVNFNSTSKYKGVRWYNRDKKWYAQIKIKGVNTHLGVFDNEEIAAEAYDKAAMQEFGEFACLNFPLTNTEILIQ